MKVISLLIIFLSSITIFSQNWALPGAQWHYSRGFVSSSTIDYYTITALSNDSIINGIPCRPLAKSYGLLCEPSPQVEYIYENNNQIYFYEQSLDTFQILYDFNKNAGESWQFIINVELFQSGIIDTITIAVDSVSIEIINGESLKKMYVNYRFAYFQNGIYDNSILIEKIGDVKNFFNIRPQIYQVCDVDFLTGLRCYNDDSLGLYETGLVPYCNYVSLSKIDEVNQNLDFQLFPNPAQNEFFISIENSNEPNLPFKIMDISGKVVLQSIANANAAIDITNLPNGYYIVQVQIGEQYVSKSLIVNR
jgi:hypothetical protein